MCTDLAAVDSRRHRREGELQNGGRRRVADQFDGDIFCEEHVWGSEKAWYG